MTGCDNNSELKVWSCELWTCLQTIKFAPTPSTGKMPVLKAGLDLSAGYLLLSDIYNKVLYILSLSKDRGEALACVSTISEFLLPYPILSFGIVDAGQRKIRPTGESLEDLCPSDEEIEDQLIIRMYLVQPKSLQECHIAFKPAAQVSGNCLLDTLTHDSLDYPEDLPDMGTANHNGISSENCEEERSLSATIEAAINHNTGSLNLMTPDAFSSPSKKESNELESNIESPELGKVLSGSPSLAQAVQALNASDTPLAASETEEPAPASCGSSPSREVREILSLTKTDEEVETDNKPETKTNTDEDWSNIPMVLLKDVSVHAMQETEEFPEDDENVQRKQPKEETKATSLPTNDTGTSWQTNNDINHVALNDKLKSILDLIQEQCQELKGLRAEVTRLQQESPVSTQVESILTRMSQQQNTTLEQTLYGQMARQREFLNTFETTIKDKIEAILPRTVEEMIEPLKHQMQLDINLMDDLLKKNVTELISSTHVKDSLALAAANAAKPVLETAFKETFATVILPSMEKICQTMFKQVQDAFVVGTRECK